MQLRILHRTAYRYDEPVKYSAQALRLTPRREGRQRVLGWSMQAPGRRVEQVDAHGNVTHLLTVEDPHKEIEIIVTGDVEVASDQWHVLRTILKGDRFEVSLDGTLLLKATDASLPQPGTVGVWSQADSIILFSSLLVAPAP